MPADRRLLVYAGTMWPVKGQGLLVEAVRALRTDHPELLLALVGYDGNPYAGHLRGHLAAHDLTDSVILAPFHDDLSTWWSAADVVALTPHSPSEALSGSLVEGMAHGLPALAARAGDAAVMVEDGRSGWLCDPDDLASHRRCAAPGRERRPVDPARVRRGGRPALCAGGRPGDGAQSGSPTCWPTCAAVR